MPMTPSLARPGSRLNLLLTSSGFSASSDLESLNSLSTEKFQDSFLTNVPKCDSETPEARNSLL